MQDCARILTASRRDTSSGRRTTDWPGLAACSCGLFLDELRPVLGRVLADREGRREVARLALLVADWASDSAFLLEPRPTLLGRARHGARMRAPN